MRSANFWISSRSWASMLSQKDILTARALHWIFGPRLARVRAKPQQQLARVDLMLQWLCMVRNKELSPLQTWPRTVRSNPRHMLAIDEQSKWNCQLKNDSMRFHIPSAAFTIASTLHSTEGPKSPLESAVPSGAWLVVTQDRTILWSSFQVILIAHLAKPKLSWPLWRTVDSTSWHHF